MKYCSFTFWKLTSLAFRNPELNTIACVFADFSYLLQSGLLRLKMELTIWYLNSTHLGIIIWILGIEYTYKKKRQNGKNFNISIVASLLDFRLWLKWELGMARGIPRPSILEFPDLFSLLDSPRNRFYNSSAPRVLAKIRRGPRNTEYRTIFSNLSRFFCFPFCFSG